MKSSQSLRDMSANVIALAESKYEMQSGVRTFLWAHSKALAAEAVLVEIMEKECLGENG